MTTQLLGRILVVLAALGVAALVAAFVPVDGNGAGARAPHVAAATR